jgi:hypothetical protein
MFCDIGGIDRNDLNLRIDEMLTQLCLPAPKPVACADAANRRHLELCDLFNACNNFRLKPLTLEILA